MKMGIRKPNIKKSIKARTTGKLKRQMKKAVNPMYGKKGMGMIKNPKKAIYNKVYNKTTIGVSDLVHSGTSTSHSRNSKSQVATAKNQMATTKSQVATATPKHSPTTYKVAGVIVKIAAIIIILLSLLLLLAVPGTGVVFGIVGVLLFALGKSYTKKAKADFTSNVVNTPEVQPTSSQKQECDQPVQQQLPTPKSATQQQSKPESEKDYDLFDDYDADDETYLAYSYEENLAFADTVVLTGNGGKVITFKQEPDNEHDKNAVAVYLNDIKVGYLYRGRTQDMVNDWISRDMPFWSYVNKIDTINNKATIKIGFYRSLSELAMKKFRLTRITKKADEFGSSRCDNVGCCSEGDLVEYTTSFDSDNYIITDECGEELGELGAKAVEFIDEHEDSIKFMRINNIEDTDSGGYKADIEIFYKK